MELMSVTVAGGLSAFAAFAGVVAGALTPTAGVMAAGVGTAIGIGTGWPGLLALGAFFVTASTVSILAERFQPGWSDAKGNRRDPRQVLANGGVAAVAGLVGLVLSREAALWIVVPSLAAASSDTWATAVGALSRRDPMHLVRRTRVPKGTSGGVSLIGTAGGILGAAVVAFTPRVAGAPLSLCLAAFALGILGMVADSMLGGTVQGRYFCPECRLPSERPVHRCGIRTRPAGGKPWLDNDGVNLLATLFAGLAGLGWWGVCCSP
jgi:uncharacterized protein (TIGR00297 family)